MQHFRARSIVAIPPLVPDDDANDTSYDTSVELSFFDTALFVPRNLPGQTEYGLEIDVKPVQPLKLKRRQEDNVAVYSE